MAKLGLGLNISDSKAHIFPAIPEFLNLNPLVSPKELLYHTDVSDQLYQSI